MICVAFAGAVGLMVWAALGAAGRATAARADLSAKLTRNVEWQTWCTAIDFLTKGVISERVATTLVGQLPEELGGPYRELTVELASLQLEPHPWQRRAQRRLERLEYLRSQGIEPPIGRRGPPPWLRARRPADETA
jgi:hypothetical protein